MVNRKKPAKSRGRRVMLVAALLLLVAGLATLLFPSVSQFLYQRQAREINTAFAARTARYSAAQRDEIYEQMRAYNEALYASGQSGLVDAFSYEQVDFSLKAFGFEEEMAGYLSIPAMGVELPVYLGASRENLNRGAAHLSQTSLPIGGPNTNAVIAAHRGMPRADMFRHIDKLAVGDEILFTNYRETLVYEVAEIAVILPEEIDRVLIQPGRELLTLVTCNPYGQNYERYVVYARRAAG